MTSLAFILVFVSLFTHAYWNFLLKDSGNKQIFIALSKVAEVVLFALPAVYLLSLSSLNFYLLGVVCVGAVITFFNYLFLSQAYQQGELSLAYPISRSGILFLPFLAWLLIDEKMDTVGWIAAILILLGTIVLHLESFAPDSLKVLWKNLKNRSTVYSLMAAFTVAGYTLWGKIAVEKMQPFLYLYLYTLIVAVMYALVIGVRFTKSEIQSEWKERKFKIIQVGFFNSFSYWLTLIALTMSKAAYVGGLRQLSVVAGAFLGYRYLNENIGFPRMVGILLSLAGGALIYFAE